MVPRESGGVLLPLHSLRRFHHRCVHSFQWMKEAQAQAFEPVNQRDFHSLEVTGDLLKPRVEGMAANTSLLWPNPRDLGPDMSECHLAKCLLQVALDYCPPHFPNRH